MRVNTSLRAGALALAAALLVACGSDGGDNGSPSAGDNAGQPRSGGTATLIQHGEPRSLDPAAMLAATSGNTLVGNSLYGQLVLTESSQSQAGPGLAESLETSDGGTTWTLKLRDGLTFSDGTPLDAAAVQFNWKRLADPAVSPTVAGFAGLVKTMTPAGQSLSFTLAQPVASFPNTIARTPMNWIASPKALQAGPAKFDAAPIGAGPFTLKSWQRQGQMVLVRSDSYWDKPRPYLDQLVLTANGDGVQRLSTVASGGADGATASAADLRKQAEDQGLNVTSDEASDAIVLVMNNRMAPFDDVRARRAVGLAVDWDAVNEVAYAGAADVPRTVFLPDDSPLNGDVKLPEHDKEAAQELFDELAAAGKPFRFLLTTIQTTESRRVNEAVQAQLNQYKGVKVDIEVLDFSAWLAKLAQKTFQMQTGSLPSDPLALQQSLTSSSPANSSGVSSPELDAALQKLVSSPEQTDREKAGQEVARLYSELLPAVSYSTLESTLLHKDRLQGVQFYSDGCIRTDTMWVTE